MMTGSAGFLLGFENAVDEVTDVDLPWSGASLPDWLDGLLLVRNGPALFDLPEQDYRHWFDGLAMLERFAVQDGSISYSNRFLQTRDHRRSTAAGRARYTEFGTIPRRNLLQRLGLLVRPGSLFGDNASVNVQPAGDEWRAIWDLPRPVHFDPTTLETLGVSNEFAGPRVLLRTPHPLLDPDTDEWVNVGVGLTWRGPAYAVISARPPTLHPEVVATIPTWQPAYMHSFAMTEHFVVITDHPYGPTIGGGLEVATGSGPIIDVCRWREAPVRFLLIDRTLGRLVATIEAEPFAVLHHVNAYEDAGGRVVVDLCAYDDAHVLETLFLAALRAPGGGALPRSQLRRYRLDLANQSATVETMSEAPLELPRVDPRRIGRTYRYAYGYTMQRPDDFNDALTKVDLDERRANTWFVAGCYPGEPVFVPRPAGSAEDDGVVLSLVLDSNNATSFLLALDGGTFEEIGRAVLPHPVPHGLHGYAMLDGRP